MFSWKTEAFWVALVFSAAIFVSFVDPDSLSDVVKDAQGLLKFEPSVKSRSFYLMATNDTNNTNGTGCSDEEGYTGADCNVPSGDNTVTTTETYTSVVITYQGVGTMTLASGVSLVFGLGAKLVLAASSVRTFSGGSGCSFNQGSEVNVPSTAQLIFQTITTFQNMVIQALGQLLFSAYAQLLAGTVCNTGAGSAVTFSSMTSTTSMNSRTFHKCESVQVNGDGKFVTSSKFMSRSSVYSFFEVKSTARSARALSTNEGTVTFGADTFENPLTVSANTLVQVETDESAISTAGAYNNSGTYPTVLSKMMTTIPATSKLQFLAVSATSRFFQVNSFDDFSAPIEVGLASTTNTKVTGEFTRVLAILRRTSTAQACPSSTCTITGCMATMDCSCAWDSFTGSDSAAYCRNTFTSAAKSTGDDSNTSLWGLLALLLLPLLCCLAFFFMRKKPEPAFVEVPVDYPEIVPEYPEEVTVYPVASVEYPMDEFYAGQPVQLNVSPY